MYIYIYIYIYMTFIDVLWMIKLKTLFLSVGRGSFMSITNECYAHGQHSGTSIIRYATE